MKSYPGAIMKDAIIFPRSRPRCKRMKVRALSLESEVVMWMHNQGSACLIKRDEGAYYGFLSITALAQILEEQINSNVN